MIFEAFIIIGLLIYCGFIMALIMITLDYMFSGVKKNEEKSNC